MRRSFVRLQYNSPVVLTFALLSLGALFLGIVTDGATTRQFFSVYRAPLTDLWAWPRFVLHVLGHSSYSHYIGNMMMILVVGPPLEEKYGSRSLFWAIFLTALISGLVQWLFFPGTALLGASGIAFMMIRRFQFRGNSQCRANTQNLYQHRVVQIEWLHESPLVFC